MPPQVLVSGPLSVQEPRGRFRLGAAKWRLHYGVLEAGVPYISLFPTNDVSDPRKCIMRIHFNDESSARVLDGDGAVGGSFLAPDANSRGRRHSGASHLSSNTTAAVSLFGSPGATTTSHSKCVLQLLNVACTKLPLSPKPQSKPFKVLDVDAHTPDALRRWVRSLKATLSWLKHGDDPFPALATSSFSNGPTAAAAAAAASKHSSRLSTDSDDGHDLHDARSPQAQALRPPLSPNSTTLTAFLPTTTTLTRHAVRVPGDWRSPTIGHVDDVLAAAAEPVGLAAHRGYVPAPPQAPYARSDYAWTDAPDSPPASPYRTRTPQDDDDMDGGAGPALPPRSRPKSIVVGGPQGTTTRLSAHGYDHGIPSIPALPPSPTLSTRSGAAAGNSRSRSVPPNPNRRSLINRGMPAQIEHLVASLPTVGSNRELAPASRSPTPRPPSSASSGGGMMRRPNSARPVSVTSVGTVESVDTAVSAPANMVGGGRKSYISLQMDNLLDDLELALHTFDSPEMVPPVPPLPSVGKYAEYNHNMPKSPMTPRTPRTPPPPQDE
ncbi:hypothetical protein AMAG_00461 [Allomyces macrogynus ATCC 38327]|uniref:PH domain-containing protein n=1 Tax=Allomyces macrogynus (strain ATCC 38327) TaxID=578462 RepID=A0A0L0RWS5_ALLM3|nr:hypothetical protein AMAG_00461 [Allomyces macrogynus ATCC 38327]|eukprot:KNE54491.1 hypothetical protein AMAG_00461 [Allomyces macrogynus ATCC 38327]